MSLYFSILLASFAAPFLLSFDSKLRFVRFWPALFPASLITLAIFIIPDIIFTSEGVWGFSPQYVAGKYIAGLPVEEWLFFIVIPYCCIFIHYVYRLYSGDYTLSDKVTRVISLTLIAVLIAVAMIFHRQIYTFTYLVSSAFLIALCLILKNRILNSLYISFLIMLFPFFIVNSVLTGTFIDGEVVWYNSAEITGLRILTVPAEDSSYAFSLVLVSLLLTEFFLSKMRITFTPKK